MNDTGRALVAEFLATRSEPAFRRLYRHHAPAVYALLLRLTAGDVARAEDCLQDAWLRGHAGPRGLLGPAAPESRRPGAWRGAVAGLDRFAWRSTLRTWIRGIAINCWREGWREDRRAP